MLTTLKYLSNQLAYLIDNRNTVKCRTFGYNFFLMHPCALSCIWKLEDDAVVQPKMLSHISAYIEIAHELSVETHV